MPPRHTFGSFLLVCLGPTSDLDREKPPEDWSGGIRRDLESEAGRGKLGNTAHKL